ncbi:ammonium transporter [Candidatus Micropelagos thuwalensis]
MMSFIKKPGFQFFIFFGIFALIAGIAHAEVSAETQYVFNTFLFLVCGFLVMFMAAGFAMLEAGSVRSKNAAAICIKNISLYSTAGLLYWLVGYNLMYGVDEGGFVGGLSVWTADDLAVGAETPDYSGGYASGSDWYFQMVFCATTASIVSGTIAERLKIWPFLIFTLVLTGFIYPIVGGWEWGGGFLDANFAFSDFAGSTLVHSTGGWAALAGAIVIGSRTGRFNEDGSVTSFPGSSIPLATLGAFILWLGWFGFNGGSQLALGSALDSVAISNIFINTNLAAAAGVMFAMITSQLLYGKVDIVVALNGAIGGLVAITAEPLAPSIGAAVFIGAVGGILVAVTTPLLLKMKIDDVVGAIPAHLVCGIWGTMIVPLTNGDASYFGQFVGVISVAIFAFVASFITWTVLKYTIGLRVTVEDELAGMDVTEFGLEAYPEFSKS